VEQVNQLLEARKQMERMMKQMGRGKMPAALAPPGTAGGTVRSATRKPSSKRKKRKSGRR
jgi:signal recognition particle GTPase